MRGFLQKFRRDECGAVTVDWVVLTAALVVFGFAIALIIFTSAQDPANNVGSFLTDYEVRQP